VEGWLEKGTSSASKSSVNEVGKGDWGGSQCRKATGEDHNESPSECGFSGGLKKKDGVLKEEKAS